MEPAAAPRFRGLASRGPKRGSGLDVAFAVLYRIAMPTRRTFLHRTAAAAGGLALAAPLAAAPRFPRVFHASGSEKVRMGFIGVGMRGRSHVELVARRTDVEIVAINDIEPRALADTQKALRDAGRPEAEVYDRSPFDYQRMLERRDLDAVIVSTPWEWHVPQAVAAMRAGKAVGLEVSGAADVSECWQLVDAQEETGAPLMFLENVCYRRDVIAVLNMVRQGLFGETVHFECGYQHDLRGVKFNDGVGPYARGAEFGPKGYSEARWRTLHSQFRNGDLYPTHGVGPVMTMIDANRGNRLTRITSMATKSRGLHNYVVDVGGAAHPNASVRFALGDIVTSMIQTSGGETIVMTHDTNLPRPYSLGFRVQGTKGLWMDLNKSLHLEGTSPAHRWEEAQPYLDRYDHPLWRRYGADASGAGHGGMDFFVLHAFVEALKRKEPMPLDVYDAAVMMALTPLSEASVARGGEPMDIPDFTRGRWISRPPIFALTDEY